jgi:hypothetical protein
MLTRPLSGDVPNAAHDGPSHRTRHNHGPPVAVVPLVQHAGPQFSIQRAGSSSEDQGQLEGDQAEIPVWDRQEQRRTDHLGARKWQRVPDR